jgi:hypothetical protein
MMRKVFVSVLAVISTLVVVPSVLAALSSLALSAHRSNTGMSSPSGWASPQSVDAQRLRIGVPVWQTLTIANDGSLPAKYLLKARIGGDLRLAGRLTVVATRREDDATIFSGPATSLRSLDLGQFAAGQHATAPAPHHVDVHRHRLS